MVSVGLVILYNNELNLQVTECGHRWRGGVSAEKESTMVVLVRDGFGNGDELVRRLTRGTHGGAHSG